MLERSSPERYDANVCYLRHDVCTCACTCARARAHRRASVRARKRRNTSPLTLGCCVYFAEWTTAQVCNGCKRANEGQKCRRHARGTSSALRQRVRMRTTREGFEFGAIERAATATMQWHAACARTLRTCNERALVAF